MNTLPETGYLRLRQILGDIKANPPIPPLIPICKSSWWHGVKTGRFPKPLKLGPRTTVWRVREIRSLIDNMNICGFEEGLSMQREEGRGI